jgi:hypothetical protein
MVRRTRETVITCMGATDVPPAGEKLTNAFVGKIKLASEPWAAARPGAGRYVPAAG